MKEEIFRHVCKYIKWSEIPHGIVLTKVVLQSKEQFQGDQYNGNPVLNYEIHALVSNDGEFFITDEIVLPQKEQKQ